jgi:hexosaminidase
VVGWWIGQLQHTRGPWAQGRRLGRAARPAPPSDLLFFGWRDATKAPAARKAGFEAVSCPQEYCYFDWAEAERDGEPLAIAGYVSLEKVYAFEPGDVTGVQGNLWTEYLPTPRLVEWRAYPRLAALAEVGWGKADFADFAQRLPAHLERLKELAVNYRPL